MMLLANLKGCKIGECGGVGRPCVIVIVGRGRREGVVGFGREAISAHDTGFFGVVGGEGIATGVGGATAVVIDIGGEAGGAGGVGSFGFFACFVRTCS